MDYALYTIYPLDFCALASYNKNGFWDPVQAFGSLKLLGSSDALWGVGMSEK